MRACSTCMAAKQQQFGQQAPAGWAAAAAKPSRPAKPFSAFQHQQPPPQQQQQQQQQQPPQQQPQQQQQQQQQQIAVGTAVEANSNSLGVWHRGTVTGSDVHFHGGFSGAVTTRYVTYTVTYETHQVGQGGNGFFGQDASKIEAGIPATCLRPPQAPSSSAGASLPDATCLANAQATASGGDGSGPACLASFQAAAGGPSTSHAGQAEVAGEEEHRGGAQRVLQRLPQRNRGVPAQVSALPELGLLRRLHRQANAAWAFLCRRWVQARGDHAGVRPRIRRGDTVAGRPECAGAA